MLILLIKIIKNYALKFSPTVNNPPAFFKTSVIGICDGAVFLINVSNL